VAICSRWFFLAGRKRRQAIGGKALLPGLGATLQELCGHGFTLEEEDLVGGLAIEGSVGHHGVVLLDVESHQCRLECGESGQGRSARRQHRSRSRRRNLRQLWSIVVRQSLRCLSEHRAGIAGAPIVVPVSKPGFGG